MNNFKPYYRKIIILPIALIILCAISNIVVQKHLPKKDSAIVTQQKSFLDTLEDKSLTQKLKKEPFKLYVFNSIGLLAIAFICFSIVLTTLSFKKYPEKLKFLPIKSFKFSDPLTYEKAVIIFSALYFWFTITKLLSLYSILLKNNSLLTMLLTTAIIQLSCIVTVLYLAKRSFWRLKHRFIKQIPQIFKVYLQMLPLIFIAGVFWSQIIKAFGLPLNHMPIIEIMFDSKLPSWAMFVICIEAVILAPIAEELIFRGVLFSTLRNNLSFALSALISAVLFSLLHGNYLSFLPIAVLAFVFSWIYEKTNNLAYPIILHSIYNTVSLAMLLSLKFVIN